MHGLYIAYLVLGLIAGAIAKAILPRRQGGGLIATLILGVIGALVGGWLGGLLFGVEVGSFFSPSTWLCAIGGSVVVLFAWGLLAGRHRTAKP
ncbi:GlsB/YeaQ/YmgE family stress response membrane protein [Brevibacterium aurantiacum]|uniref:GlsB/YeaQ/YmgE family stress response membrane protein n=1 Tax=Brevibacterium aurantiacum TaxID=273384 RepID=UPI000F645E3C|nr:GlsB/YeaQ/YmgE family stress response membrane protein [Brevibacterium aurantiacum]AZL13980.1 GlsB/YeaQ/YmgE family stress response membrane protein [Brevibacterium aurantiacum]